MGETFSGINGMTPAERPMPSPVPAGPGVLCTTVLLLGVALGCGARTEDGVLRVGSKKFTESVVLAEILTQLAQAHEAIDGMLTGGEGGNALGVQHNSGGARVVIEEYLQGE